jgi:hypothetical protein
LVSKAVVIAPAIAIAALSMVVFALTGVAKTGPQNIGSVSTSLNPENSAIISDTITQYGTSRKPLLHETISLQASSERNITLKLDEDAGSKARLLGQIKLMGGKGAIVKFETTNPRTGGFSNIYIVSTSGLYSATVESWTIPSTSYVTIRVSNGPDDAVTIEFDLDVEYTLSKSVNAGSELAMTETKTGPPAHSNTILNETVTLRPLEQKLVSYVMADSMNVGAEGGIIKGTISLVHLSDYQDGRISISLRDESNGSFGSFLIIDKDNPVATNENASSYSVIEIGHNITVILENDSTMDTITFHALVYAEYDAE